MQRSIRVVAQHVHGPVVRAVVVARYVAAAEDEGDDAEGGRVDGEGPDHRRPESPSEHRHSHLLVRLPATVPETTVFVRHIRLNTRLDDVNGVGGDPCGDAGHAPC